MQSFELLSQKFALHFEQKHFPTDPVSLYGPNEYFLRQGGKRIRPVLCLMGNELFDEIKPDAWEMATAIELFHNFTLIHDDIMDNAPLRRGAETVHKKYGPNTAILAGDVMLIAAYELMNNVSLTVIRQVQNLFNTTAKEVCEGQQYDMDFENRESVSFGEYLRMIELKTSVLIAASLKMGAILGGAGQRNQDLIYDFGRKLGLAFQVQDDYLDAFGDPHKFGKQVGGDILANKKTFLLIHALEKGSESQKKELKKLMTDSSPDKVKKTLQVFIGCKSDKWALELKDKFLDEALQHLEDIAVTSSRKEPLIKLAQFLIQRQY
ncbi:MAG TPA: polyprenyl synthetase family protein [Chitinophagaceae bacterium]|nr:polyprenyl synthetase family protein [Chitinophagaceae bacterium]